MKENIELALTVLLVALCGVLVYNNLFPNVDQASRGPEVGEVLDVAVEGPVTVALFTTTCPWCAKSWDRWLSMPNVQMVSLDSPEATQAYLDANGYDVDVIYARISTPVPVEFDLDQNLTILDKRLGYLGDSQ